MSKSLEQLSLESSPQYMSENIRLLSSLVVRLAGQAYEMAYFINYLNALVCLYADLDTKQQDELTRYSSSYMQKTVATFNLSQKLEV